MLTEKQTLLAAFDDARSHKWESFDHVTKDLTEAEVQFVHPIYAEEKQEEGWPTPGSILWHLVHMEYWYRYYIDCLEKPTEDSPLPTPDSAATLETAMEKLNATRKTLRNRISDIPDEGLDFSLRGRIRTGEFIRMIIRHDSWHSAQIALARRLFRTRTT
jgi:uncharacterized damage-inducible protein DinB